jgi:hypothetical protein
MNKNIKMAIYFLVGIILFYLMFNGNKVEGFGEDVGFIYVKVDTEGATGSFERFDKVTDAAEITTIETPIVTPNGLQEESNTILTDGTKTYYKSGENLFIQKVTGGSYTTYTGAALISNDFTNQVENLIVTVGETVQTISLETGITDAASAVSALSGLTSATASVVDGNVMITSNIPGAGTIAITGDTDAVALFGVGETVLGTDPTTEYYLINKSTDTPPVISSIHKITSDLSSLTAEPITGTGDGDTTLHVYNVTAGGDSGVTTGEYQASPDTTTVTIDTFSRCSTPEDITGYTPVETSLKLGEDFNVTGTCASGYTGTLAAVACEADNTPYTLDDCNASSTDSSTTYPYTCTNGSAVDGSSSTQTQSCAECNPGYHKTGSICIQNGSCSDFITDTNKCPDGKEKIEDKSCSGACSKDECCEDESDAMMIALGVCGLCLCLILLGGGAFVVMGKSSAAPKYVSA